MSLVTPSHQGGQSSFAALELIANPAKLQEKIDSLKSAEASAREQIELAGPASEILQIRSEIDALKEEAQKLLESAMADATEIEMTANAVAVGIVKDAEDVADTEERQAAENVKKAESRVSGIKTHETAVQRQVEIANQRSKDLDRREEELQQKAAALASREQELTGEAEKFVKVRELIVQTLR